MSYFDWLDKKDKKPHLVAGEPIQANTVNGELATNRPMYPDTGPGLKYYYLWHVVPKMWVAKIKPELWTIAGNYQLIARLQGENLADLSLQLTETYPELVRPLAWWERPKAAREHILINVFAPVERETTFGDVITVGTTTGAAYMLGRDGYLPLC